MNSKESPNSTQKNNLSSFEIGFCSGISMLFMILAPTFYFMFETSSFLSNTTFQLLYLGPLFFYGLPIFSIGLIGFTGFKVFSKLSKNYNKKLILILLPILVLTIYLFLDIFLNDIPPITFTGFVLKNFGFSFLTFGFLTFVIGGIINYFKIKIFFSVNETAFLLNMFITTGIILTIQHFTSDTSASFALILIMAIPLGLIGQYISRQLILKIHYNKSHKKEKELTDYENNYLKRLDDD